jgi:hypothetical protein
VNRYFRTTALASALACTCTPLLAQVDTSSAVPRTQTGQSFDNARQTLGNTRDAAQNLGNTARQGVDQVRQSGQQFQQSLRGNTTTQGQSNVQGQFNQGQSYQGQPNQGQVYQGQSYQNQAYQNQPFQGNQYQGNQMSQNWQQNPGMSSRGNQPMQGNWNQGQSQGQMASNQVYTMRYDSMGREFICVNGQPVYFTNTSSTQRQSNFNGQRSDGMQNDNASSSGNAQTQAGQANADNRRSAYGNYDSESQAGANSQSQSARQAPVAPQALPPTGTNDPGRSGTGQDGTQRNSINSGIDTDIDADSNRGTGTGANATNRTLDGTNIDAGIGADVNAERESNLPTPSADL